MRALVKLEQVLPAHLRRRVAALGSATIAPAGRRPDRRPPAPDRDRRRLPRLRVPALRLPQPRRHRTAGARSSRTRSSTSAAAGTSSPGTARARTGAPSASTASPRPASTGVALRRRASCRPTDAAAYVEREHLRRRRTATRRASRCTRRPDEIAGARPARTGARSSRSTRARCEFRTGDDDLELARAAHRDARRRLRGPRAAGAGRAPLGDRGGAEPRDAPRQRRLAVLAGHLAHDGLDSVACQLHRLDVQARPRDEFVADAARRSRRPCRAPCRPSGCRASATRSTGVARGLADTSSAREVGNAVEDRRPVLAHLTPPRNARSGCAGCLLSYSSAKQRHERVDVTSIHGDLEPLGDLALAVHEESLRPGSHATRRRAPHEIHRQRHQDDPDGRDAADLEDPLRRVAEGATASRPTDNDATRFRRARSRTGTRATACG